MGRGKKDFIRFVCFSCSSSGDITGKKNKSRERPGFPKNVPGDEKTPEKSRVKSKGSFQETSVHTMEKGKERRANTLFAAPRHRNSPQKGESCAEYHQIPPIHVPLMAKGYFPAHGAEHSRKANIHPSHGERGNTGMI